MLLLIRNKFVKVLLVALGIVSTALGLLGIVLPVLPTTPFVLLAGLLFSYSSERLSLWLERNKLLGPYLSHYKHGLGVPRKVKVKALVMLWLGLGFTFYLVGKPILILMLCLIGGAVSIHIITIKPRMKEEKQLA